MRALIQAQAALLFAGFSTFLLMGMGQALFGPALPALSRHFGITTGEAGMLISAQWVGSFIGVGVMFLHGEKITPRVALALLAAGAAGIAALAGWAVTLGAAVIFGLGYGMATAVFNPRVLVAFGPKGASMLSLLNAAYAAGAIAAPLIFLALSSDPRLGFGLTAGLYVLIWLAAGGASSGGVAAPRLKGGFRPYWPILVFGACTVGLEATLIGLGPTALVAAGLGEDQAARNLSAFFVVFLLARVALTFAAHLIAPFTLLTLALVLAALAALGTVLGDPGLFFALMGAPAGMFFPGFFVTATRKMGNDPRVTPTILASGLVGGILLPLIIAPMMAGLGERGFFWIILGIVLATTLAAAASFRAMNR